MALISGVTQQTGNLLCFIARHLLETWGWDDKLVFIEFNWSCLKGIPLVVQMWFVCENVALPLSAASFSRHSCHLQSISIPRWKVGGGQQPAQVSHPFIYIFKKAAFHKNSIFWSCVTVGWYEIQKLTNQELLLYVQKWGWVGSAWKGVKICIKSFIKWFPVGVLSARQMQKEKVSPQEDRSHSSRAKLYDSAHNTYSY